jgi:hypothetical protein
MNEIFRVRRDGAVAARIEGPDLMPAFQAAVVAAVTASGGEPVEVQRWDRDACRYETIPPHA